MALKRHGRSKEVAAVIAFRCSEQSQEIGSCPTLRAGLVAALASSQARPSSGSGWTAIITSARGANAATDCGPLTATASGTRASGLGQIPELGRVDPVVLPYIVYVTAVEQRVDDVDGFLKSFVALAL